MRKGGDVVGRMMLKEGEKRLIISPCRRRRPELCLSSHGAGRRHVTSRRRGVHGVACRSWQFPRRLSGRDPLNYCECSDQTAQCG